MLIATLPPVYREGLLHQIISSDEISGVRYNSGMVSPHTPEDTLSIIKVLTEGYGKKFQAFCYFHICSDRYFLKY